MFAEESDALRAVPRMSLFQEKAEESEKKQKARGTFV